MGKPQLALAVAALTAALLIAAIVLVVAEPTARSAGFLTTGLVAAPIAAGLGVLVARRQPANVVGALVGTFGLAVTFTVTREIGWQVLAERPVTLAELDWLVAVLNESSSWGFVAVALLLLYFPDGQLPSRRWRPVPTLLVVSAAAVQARGAFGPEEFRRPLTDLPRPWGPPPVWIDLLGLVGFVMLLALVLACALSLVGRHHRGDRIRRAQVKWLALAGLGVALYPLLILAGIAISGEPSWLPLIVAVGAVVGIPVATAIAVLRHDLYDIDKAIAGTLTWGLVTLVLVAVYATASFGAGLVLGRGSPAVAAGATAFCALALSPLRQRVRRRVDRRFYPLRRAASAAIDELLREAAAGRARPEQLQDVLRAALRDPSLRIGYQVPGSSGYVDTIGDAVDSDGVPIVLGGSTIGVLAGRTSTELLRDVAGRATTIVEVVRLRLELAGALREVESSRARLVQVGDQERQRFERDLHDGAQQRLVSLGMALRLAQRHLDDGTVDVDGLLDQTVAELGTAVAELRQIAHGLRPSSLDRGLSAALTELLRHVPLPVDMHVCDDPVPEDVATTAYYVVAEAVANTVKHADATAIDLQVTRTNGSLLVRVRDDGIGGVSLHATSALADRIAALGGTLRIDSPPGHGTVVEVALPCAS